MTAAPLDGDALRGELTTSITSLMELYKLLPLGAATMPGATDPRLTRTWISGERRRLETVLRQNAPPCTVDDAAIDAHRAWLDRGAKGEGQLVLEAKRMRDERYDDVDWTFVEIAHSDLTNVYLAKAKLQFASLEDVVFTGANLGHALLASARIRGGLWTHASMGDINLSEADVTETDFSASDMEGAKFVEARVEGAKFDGVRFGNAVLDRAVFRACSFREASFANFAGEPRTSIDASLIDCDLTATDWTDRDLSRTTFIRCKLAGAHGKPMAIDGLVLEDCVIDAARFVAQLSGAAPHQPRATSQPSPKLVEIVDALIGAPALPQTVRDLEHALGFTLTAVHLAACSQPGTLVIREGLPPPLVGVGLKWRGETLPRSVDGLRGRALESGWYIELAEGRAYVDARLRARLDTPQELSSGNEYTSKDAVFTISWPDRGERCTLGVTARPM